MKRGELARNKSKTKLSALHHPSLHYFHAIQGNSMDTDRLAELKAERDALVQQILSAQSPARNTSTPITQQQIDAALEAARKARLEHIRRLGKYNEIKDVAQELIGMVAEMRACRVVDVMRDFEIEDDD